MCSIYLLTNKIIRATGVSTWLMYYVSTEVTMVKFETDRKGWKGRLFSV